MISIFGMHGLPPNVQSSGTIQLDASNEYAAGLIAFFESKAIRYVHFYVVTNTTDGDVNIALKDCNDTVQPAIPGSVLGSTQIAYTITTTGWKRVQLAADYTPAVGEEVFLTLDWVGGNNAIGLVGSDFLDNLHYSTGVSSSNTYNLACAFESTDGTFLKCSSYPYYRTALTLNTDSDPDEIGNLFIFPFMHKICGARFSIDLDYAADLYFYGSSNYYVSMPANRRYSTGRTLSSKFFANDIKVAPNETYRLVIKPTTSSSVSLYQADFPTSYETAARAAIEGGSGVTINKTYRTNAGSWTNTGNSVISILPIITAVGMPTPRTRGARVR